MTSSHNDFPFPSTLPPAIARSFPVQLLSSCYAGVISMRNFFYDHVSVLSKKAGRPVISIGGIRAGGTGKTPAALLVGSYLDSKNIPVCFLSRGYGRKNKSAQIVKPDEMVSWELVGDEPWLLHNRLPKSWLGIGSNRFASAKLCEVQIPQSAIFVLDDGFQHRGLRRDLEIVCLHADLFADKMLPAGYLREPVSSLARAQVLFLIGSPEEEQALATQCEALTARFCIPSIALVHEAADWINIAGNGAAPPVDPVLVCGIARPDRFCSTVRAAGMSPSAELIFPDHHVFVMNDFPENRELYSKGVVTTEKDAVRLRGRFPDDKIWYCTTRLRFVCRTDEEQLRSLIDRAISSST
ncbi:MAG: tetraacyldisaccharide 4'-kinase [Chitinispirillaceae bacterium]|jgi:tetraacyldisaccharide 4'-kinase|nr:tetraacyldisaccharide 4'-kinase [Chitinispirillaceae bacterium]